jgi:ABC-2 type transport system ATP-binding protein
VGKTTTIRLLTGQIDPSGGKAIVAGCDVVKDRTCLKGMIGVVFQEQNLYERLSAFNNLRFNCWLYNLPLNRIDEVLELVHLKERSKEPVRKLSGGMKQGLMIARALLHDLPVLFLDEPTRDLNPIAAREVREAIKNLNQNGKTVLVTTHLLKEADQLCERVAFIIDGYLVANDTPENLKLSDGRQTLKLTLSDPNHPNQLTQQVLNMDEEKDQRKLSDLMAHANVHAIHSQEAALSRRKPCVCSWSRRLL